MLRDEEASPVSLMVVGTGLFQIKFGQ